MVRCCWFFNVYVIFRRSPVTTNKRSAFRDDGYTRKHCRSNVLQDKCAPKNPWFLQRRNQDELKQYWSKPANRFILNIGWIIYFSTSKSCMQEGLYYHRWNSDLECKNHMSQQFRLSWKRWTRKSHDVVKMETIPQLPLTEPN